MLGGEYTYSGMKGIENKKEHTEGLRQLVLTLGA